MLEVAYAVRCRLESRIRCRLGRDASPYLGDQRRVGRIVLDEPFLTSDHRGWGERTREPFGARFG
jgi:hypothetical protein